ncbi:hypothetical protein ACWGBX_07160 [Streptomyces sp. NPDC055037]
MRTRPRILFVSDMSYQARGRRYGDEDVYLVSELRAAFDIAVCHPVQAASLTDLFDAVVIRNSGPVMRYQAAWEAFCEQARARRTVVYNPLTGRGDMVGKQYLLDLTEEGYPVIPTVGRAADLDRLPACDEYAVKLRTGADSIGLEFVGAERLPHLSYGNILVQPRVRFRYEVSFYFVDGTFHYALYAPDPRQRWALEPYRPTEEDLAFAHRFIGWNSLDHGIQRVDACRTAEGDLLLVELEDLNPFLSLALAPDTARAAFVADMGRSLTSLLSVPRP